MTSDDRMPVVFVGHGSPMNAIGDNRWTQGWRTLGADLPGAKAILSVSAHWYVPGTFVTANDRPETIHDFGGFPRALFEVQYPAPGSRPLAERISRLLADRRATPRDDWGLDHGTWSVLTHLRPDADIPVLQLSIDARQPPPVHIDIGRELAPLRDEGVLIIGSGNITHNLRDAIRHLGETDRAVPPWAGNFDRDVARAIEQHDLPWLASAVTSEDGRMSHPSLDHWLPLLYVAGAATAGEPITYPTSGFDAGSLSMRSVRYG
jgi:4,5-DOPA dioxygenase extradiol